MENGAVYNETTEPETKPPRRRSLGCTLRHMRPVWRPAAKAAQAVLSFVAVICQEIVEDCINCNELYFFEFSSCSALFLSLLILFVYCTDVYEALGEDKVQKLNVWTMLILGVLFLVASIAFAVTNSGSALESAACAFGFFATIAFLLEFAIIQYVQWRKQNVPGPSENPGNTPSAAENQPLNKQS